MPYIDVETSVLVELDVFETEDLIEEIQNRGYIVIQDHDDPYIKNPLQRLYELKSTNDSRFEKEFADFIYNAIGKVL